MSDIGKAAKRGVVLLTALTGGLAQPVLAQQQPAPTAAPLEDGEIIYSRDVHHSIGAIYVPGETDTAVTAPTSAIIGAVGLGLAPLTDSEGANITASLPAAMEPLGATEMHLTGGQGGMAGGLGQFIVSQTASGAGGSGISSAMSALTGALESLSAIGGGRP
jgi:hypothetical protein